MEIQEFPLRQQVVPDPVDAKTSAKLITDAAPIEQILTHIGEPSRPPPIAPARGPPAWDDDLGPMREWDLLKQSEPDFEFDQSVAW